MLDLTQKLELDILILLGLNSKKKKGGFWNEWDLQVN